MVSGPGSQRIVTVDALRGFALLGILLAHMIYWYTAGPLPQEIFQRYNDAGTGIVSGINEIFISGKFFAFFSFLFGLSFYLQMQSMEKREDKFVARYAWRIAILGIVGLCHHAFWQGDILSIYAPLGFLLLPLRRMSNRWVLILGILFAVNLPGKIIQVIDLLGSVPAPAPPANTPPVDGDAEGKAYFEVIRNADLIGLWKYNLGRLSTKFRFQLESGRIFVTYGFFLLGMYAGRRRWFEMPDDSRPVFKKICRKSGWLVLGTLLTALCIIAVNFILKMQWENNRIIGFVFSILVDINSACMVVFYVSGLTLLMYRQRWQKLLFPMASVGKLALTCYLGQTFLGLLLFHGIGYGLIGQTSPAFNWLIGIVFFIIQMQLGRLWLRYLSYGPIEWLWRSLTFFTWYPLRRK
jgi:uncharacterized protein